MVLPENAKKVFEGVMFQVYQWDQKQFDGSFKKFEAVKRKSSVQVIATRNDKILILEEEQPLLGKFLSLIGGICESDNFKIEAKRELLEETGMVCDNLIFWRNTNFSAKVIWNTHYFIARNCKKIKEQELDSGEKIIVKELSFDEFVEKATSDKFRNTEFSFIIMKMIINNKLEEFKKLIFGNDS